MDFDKDLQSIQEVRWLVAKAVVAQKDVTAAGGWDCKGDC